MENRHVPVLSFGERSRSSCGQVLVLIGALVNQAIRECRQTQANAYLKSPQYSPAPAPTHEARPS